MSVQIRKGNTHIGQKPVVIEKDFLVRFFDYDGTILKEQWVYSGETATAPYIKPKQYLTFVEWNNTFTDVTSDVDTGAIYRTTDGKSYLFITINEITGLSPVLTLTKFSTSLMTIDWGDNTTSTSITASIINMSHTYSSYGDYIITVDNSNGSFCFGGGVSNLRVFGVDTYRYCLTKIFFGLGIFIISPYSFHQCYSLNKIMIPKTITTISNINGVFFQECQMLKGVVLPSTITNGLGSIFQISYNLEYLILPNTITSLDGYAFNGMYNRKFTNFKYTTTSIGASTFAGNYSCEKFIIPSTVLTIGNNAFANNYQSCCYLCYPTTPPSLGTTVYNNINLLSKIYVPDASVNAYKTATGWIGVYNNYIYPLSDYKK